MRANYGWSLQSECVLRQRRWLRFSDEASAVLITAH
jgi:hypothetical protein